MRSELVYELEAYTGLAEVVIYVNKTVFNRETRTYNNRYTHLATFDIGDKASSTEPEQEGKTITQLYQNSIQSSENVNNENIMFKIQIKKPTALKVKINYSRKWINVPINAPKNFLSKSSGVLGYFDVQPDYSSVQFSIDLDEKIGKRADVYIKYHVLSKDKTNIPKDDSSEESAYNYVVPTIKNFNYRIRTDKVLGRGDVVLSRFPKIEAGKILRVLFAVKIVKYRTEQTDDSDNEYESEEISSDTPFKITIIPEIQGQSKVYTTQNIYHSTKDKFDPNKEKSKSFFLSKKNDADDTLVIELSSCSGPYTYKIFEVVNGFTSPNEVKYSADKKGGREIIIINDLKQKNYEVKVFPANNIPFCKVKKNYELNICNNDVNYLFYYYSTTAANYKYSMTDATFTYKPSGRGGVKIQIPSLKETDAFGRTRAINDLHFDVFVSNKKEEFEHMESVCYLSAMSKVYGEKKLYKNIKMKNGHIYIKGLKPGTRYFLNLLAQNPKTHELITFKPIQVESGSAMSGGSLFLIILLVVAVIAIGGLAFYFYKRFKTTQTVLRYEQNDITRMASVPKTEAEMANIANKNERVKYSTLTVNSDTI